jgi:hypothetical protein
VVTRPVTWSPAPVVSLVVAHRKEKPTAAMVAFKKLLRECFHV